MSVTKVSSIAAVDPPVGAVRPAGAASGSSQQSSQQERRPPEAPEPMTRRFPWLSWETRQLEAASKQPSPYGQVPLLGKTLDQKV
ncbi:MAG: hypothetical protein ACKVOX_12905 [Rhizobacter sp.]